MLDFFFFMKTLFLTLLVVFLLQIEIGNKTIENHLRDSMQGSVAAGFIGHAAHGGAHFIEEGAHKLTHSIKQNITSKHKGESHETKASRFNWGWNQTAEKSEASTDEADAD
jgi:hypothetical protein